MKRFYCTICKKIKRVRHFPSDTVTPRASNPAERVGSCNRHFIQSSQHSLGRDSIHSIHSSNKVNR